MFKVGSRIICVDDSIGEDSVMFVITHMPGWVERNAIYTVREIAENDGIVPGVLLEEIVNPPVWVDLVNSMIEPRFALWRFREIEEEEMEMEMDAIESLEEEFWH